MTATGGCMIGMHRIDLMTTIDRPNISVIADLEQRISTFSDSVVQKGFDDHYRFEGVHTTGNPYNLLIVAPPHVAASNKKQPVTITYKVSPKPAELVVFWLGVLMMAFLFWTVIGGVIGWMLMRSVAQRLRPLEAEIMNAVLGAFSGIPTHRSVSEASAPPEQNNSAHDTGLQRAAAGAA